MTNHRGKPDRLLTEIKLLNGSEIVAISTCCTRQRVDKIPEDTTVTVDCTSSDPLPDAYDKITIQDVDLDVRPRGPAGVTSPGAGPGPAR